MSVNILRGAELRAEVPVPFGIGQGFHAGVELSKYRFGESWRLTVGARARGGLMAFQFSWRGPKIDVWIRKLSTVLHATAQRWHSMAILGYVTLFSL